MSGGKDGGKEKMKKEETYLTEVRGLDGLATLGFTGGGDLYIDASGRRQGVERGTDRQIWIWFAREGDRQLDSSSRSDQLT